MFNEDRKFDPPHHAESNISALLSNLYTLNNYLTKSPIPDSLIRQSKHIITDSIGKVETIKAYLTVSEAMLNKGLKQVLEVEISINKILESNQAISRSN